VLQSARSAPALTTESVCGYRPNSIIIVIRVARPGGQLYNGPAERSVCRRADAGRRGDGGRDEKGIGSLYLCDGCRGCMTAVNTRSVGVIGLGRIGGHVARALCNAGRSVAAYDVLPEAHESFPEPEAKQSPRAVAEVSNIVLVAVYDDQQLRDVLLGPEGILAAVPSPDVICVLSTVTLATLYWAAEEAVSRGVELIDCGVTGGARLRDEGTIVVLAGGSEAAIDAARPALDVFARPLLHMGPRGCGMKAKLARNLMHYSAWYASWEGARLAAAAGVDVPKLLEAHRISNESGGGMSLLTAGIGPGVEPGADVTVERRRRSAYVAEKDLGYAIEMAAELGIPVPGAELVRARMQDVVGLSDD
jgi:3-hydroxyisobutyrate dehydrogenase-like beta-hydroxyacid dehydrogenase